MIFIYDLLCDEVDKELNNDVYSNASTVENNFENI